MDPNIAIATKKTIHNILFVNRFIDFNPIACLGGHCKEKGYFFLHLYSEMHKKVIRG